MRPAGASRLVAAIALGVLLAGAGAAGAQVSAPAAAQVAPADSAQAAALVQSAREHAAADRHRAAAHDYLAALRLDDRLAAEVARDLAWQQLWQEDAEQAVLSFRRHLALNPDEDDREVRKGLALALSWAGRQDEAAALWRELAAEAPDDPDVHVGLGRTLMWDNRLREGFEVLREVEESPTEAAGRRESGRLLLTALDEYTPPLEVRADGSRDSDELEILRLTARAALEAPGSLLLEIAPSRATYRQQEMTDVDAWRLGAGLVAPLAPAWTLHVNGWIDSFRSEEPLFAAVEDGEPPAGEPDDAWTQLGADGWLTWAASPRLRLDFGASLLPVETVGSLAREITIREGSASADWRFARGWLLGGGLRLADYSDGNGRLLATTRLHWRREGAVETVVGPALTWLDFQEHYPGRGYWSPDRMFNASLEAAARVRGERWTAGLEARVGREKETASDAITVGAASLRLGWRLSPGLLLAGEVGHSRSRLDNPSGYRRDFAGLSLRAFF